MKRIRIIRLVAITAERLARVLFRSNPPIQPVFVPIGIAYVVVQRISQIHLVGILQQHFILRDDISLTLVQRNIQPGHQFMLPILPQIFPPDSVLIAFRRSHAHKQRKELPGLIIQLIYQHQFTHRPHRPVNIYISQNLLNVFVIQEGQLLQILFRRRIQVERMLVQFGQIIQQRIQIAVLIVFIHRNLFHKFLP